jgi:hypothetical protein
MTQRKNRWRRKKAIRLTKPSDQRSIRGAIKRSFAPAAALMMSRTVYASPALFGGPKIASWASSNSCISFTFG